MGRSDVTANRLWWASLGASIHPTTIQEPYGQMFRISKVIACALFLGMACRPVLAEVTRVQIEQRQTLAGGMRFGQVGAYESISGRLFFEVDPDDPINQRIVDLQFAPRNANGRVEFWADFFLMQPVDPNKGNGCLLYDVHNRGNKLALSTFNEGETDQSTHFARACRKRISVPPRILRALDRMEWRCDGRWNRAAVGGIARGAAEGWFSDDGAKLRRNLCRRTEF